MKFLLLICLIFSLNLSLFSQIEYPRYSVDSLGQKILCLTIPQAMKIDNNLELLSLFEKLDANIADYDSICIKTINDKNRVINSQKIEIATLKKSVDIKDQQIFALQREIAGYIKTIGLLEEEVTNRKLVIDEKNIQLLQLKTKSLIGGIGGGIIIVGLIAIILSIK